MRTPPETPLNENVPPEANVDENALHKTSHYRNTSLQTFPSKTAPHQISRKRNIGAQHLTLKRRKRKRQSVKTPSIIDLDQYSSPKRQPEKKWITHSHYSLSAHDRSILLNPLGWPGRALARMQRSKLQLYLPQSSHKSMCT